MSAFAAQEAARTRLLARQRQEPDEDGFVTVTRGGRSGPQRHEEAQEKAEKQQKKQKGLEDFYRFQTREKRKEKAGELVRRFQDDRHKLKEMKERRGGFRVSAPDTFGTVASANDVCSRSRSGQRCRTIPPCFYDMINYIYLAELCKVLLTWAAICCRCTQMVRRLH